MSIRPKVEPALLATAERLSPGAGEQAVHHAKNDLSLLDATHENFSSRYAGEDVRIASPAVFEGKHVDGDPVEFKKAHDGLIIAFSDSFLFVRGVGFAVREVKAIRNDEVQVEKITTVLDGAEVPGLRIKAKIGKPHFALAITVPDATSDPAVQAAVRDEIYAQLTS